MSKILSKRDLVQRFQFTHSFDHDIVPILASILTDLCENNDRRNVSYATKFQASARPPISVFDYLERIYQYADCSETCFILALIFIDRIQSRAEYSVTSLNIHRLLITSLMLSAKFFDDQYYNNAFYARIGGISTQEINQLELEFLFNVGFSLSVTPDQFALYYKELYAHAMVLRGINHVTATSTVATAVAANSPAPAPTPSTVTTTAKNHNVSSSSSSSSNSNTTTTTSTQPIPIQRTSASRSQLVPQQTSHFPQRRQHTTAFPNPWTTATASSVDFQDEMDELIPGFPYSSTSSDSSPAASSASSSSSATPAATPAVAISSSSSSRSRKKDSPCGDKRMRIRYDAQQQQQSQQNLIFS